MKPLFFREKAAPRVRELAVCAAAAAALLLAAVAAVLLLPPGAPTSGPVPPRGTEGSSGTAAGREGTPGGTARTDGSSVAEAGPDYLTLSLTERDLSRGTLVLVNADLAFDPESAETVRLFYVKNRSYYVSDTTVRVTAETADALNRWMAAFHAAAGPDNAMVAVGWRDLALQDSLYRRALREHGADYAESYFELPGHSEHHTGLAVDLDTWYPETELCGGFDGGGAYAWLAAHAWEYGLVLRYPEGKETVTGIAAEAWHFRFVGAAHAAVMHRLDLCLEEYLSLLRRHPFDGEHLFAEAGGERFEIWYCPGLTVTVPADGLYALSGDNEAGFVVTVRR